MAANPYTSAQAPSTTMQFVAPDLSAQQMQLQRRQQLVDLLRSQSLEPIGNTEVINGWAIKKSPLEPLGKLAQALAAAYAQKKIDDQQLDLYKGYQGRLGTVANGDQQTTAQSTNDATDQATNTSTAQQFFSTNPFNIGNYLKSRIAQDVGGEPAAAAFWDQYKPTNEMKNNDALGITTQQAKELELARRLKEGTMSLQPGQTNVMPDGSKMVAPNFESGIAGGFDAQGNPVANAVAGASAIAAQNAGAIAQAQEGQKLLPMDHVDTTGRPIGGTIGEYLGTSNNLPYSFQGSDLISQLPKSEQRALLKNIPADGKFNLDYQLPNGKGRVQGSVDINAPSQTNDNGVQLAQAKANGRPLLQSAQEKALAEASVKNATEPNLALKTKNYENMADYENKLNDHLNEAQAELQRIAESRDALAKFKSGGGAEAKLKLAQIAQSIPGVSQELVDKIAGGDLSAVQVFQKFAAQEAFAVMKDALSKDTGTDGATNRIAMTEFLNKNPNITTDGRAIEKLFNFRTKLANQWLDKSNTYQQYRSNPQNDPTQFPNYWANQQIKKGYVNPEIKSGYAKGVATPPKMATPPHIQSILDNYK